MAGADSGGGGQRKESTKARFHASLEQRKIPLGGTLRGKMAKTYTANVLMASPDIY